MLLKRDLENYFLSFLIFIVFSFSDFYFSGIGRVFDYLFLVGLFVYCFAAQIKISKKMSSSTYLVVILSMWLFVGMLNQSGLASLAIFVGAGFVFFFFNRKSLSVEPKSIDPALKVTIFINASILIVQILIFYRLGSYLDFHSMVGSIESRGFNESLNYFRPSGLFQEPNAYCTAMFCLLSLRIVTLGTPSYIDYFGWLTMILTQSLWGFGAAILLFWFMVGPKRFILFLIPIGITGYFLFSSSMSSLENSITMTRIMNIGDDSSRIARYGSLDNLVIDIFFLLGHGIDSSNFQSIAANAFGFLIYCFGVFGFILLILWAKFIQKISLKHALLIAFLLTTFPLFSYMYFWVWLGLTLTLKNTDRKLNQSYEKVAQFNEAQIGHIS